MSVRHNKVCFFLLLCAVGLSLGIPGSSPSTDDFSRGGFQAGSYSEAAARFTRAERATPGTTDAFLYQAKCFVHLRIRRRRGLHFGAISPTMVRARMAFTFWASSCTVRTVRQNRSRSTPERPRSCP